MLKQEYIAAPFDASAVSYDNDFSYTLLGQCYRKYVQKYLEKQFFEQQNKPLQILEINCGTGEDAIWMAAKNHEVIATDISSEMIKVATSKNKEENSLFFRQVDIETITTATFPNKKFDLIFSNFGGLNCLSKESLQKLPGHFAELLSPGGRVVMVVMGKRCWWEMLYFLLKANPQKAFRRFRKDGVYTKISGETAFQTYYYTTKEIRQIFKREFNMWHRMPVGIALPPSYLNPFMLKNKRLYNMLNYWEKALQNASFLSDEADHYLIDLEIKPNKVFANP